jgi:hypothetical protein
MNLRDIGRGIVWFAIGVAAVIAVSLFLLHRESGPSTQSLIIRSYPVAPEIAGEMSSAIGNAILPQGRVSLSTGGRLLVVAPESLQRGVQAILQEVATKKPAPSPAIHFELWAVSAAPGTAARPDEGPGLSEIAPALGELQKAREAMHFTLLEKLALQVRAGDNNTLIQGVRVGFQISPTVRYDAKGDPVIAARIDVQQVLNGIFGGQPGSLRAAVELRPGQLLVIGQSSLPPSSAGAPTPQSQLYYIVRASL